MEEKKMMNIFESESVPKAVLQNALPAMAAMLMVLIYNLADTFFIGQTHDALQVAAVSLATPVFLIFMSVGTVFGVGGTSIISRILGEGRTEYAGKICSFCMWSCVAVGIILSVFFLVFMDLILAWVGASEDTWEMAKTYLTIVSFSGPFVLIANCYNNVIRAEGQSTKAMMGQLIGNLLNVILDPILISAFGMGITGAAVATVIGNVVGAGYYIVYFLRGNSILSIRIKDFTVKENVCGSVLAIGIPASLGSLLMSVSQIVVNNRMAGYGDMALAGIGVAMKVMMITGMICIGFGQGIQPLLGYCVGAGLWERFKQIMKFSLAASFLLSAVMTGGCYLLKDRIAGMFLTDADALRYAVKFISILLSTSILFGIFYVLNNALQAMGAATSALVINLSRQGIIYIPAIFILQAVLQENGIVWAQPTADILSTIFVLLLFMRSLKKMQNRTGDTE